MCMLLKIISNPNHSSHDLFLDRFLVIRTTRSSSMQYSPYFKLSAILPWNSLDKRGCMVSSVVPFKLMPNRERALTCLQRKVYIANKKTLIVISWYNFFILPAPLLLILDYLLYHLKNIVPFL